mmetsp:Transcript_76722/g.151796  ORF Transcript_76722/g.151796 Transcript_76722/m.151796 type:complete len:102 (-) Transcript_76722:646-951(-)
MQLHLLSHLFAEMVAVLASTILAASVGLVPNPTTRGHEAQDCVQAVKYSQSTALRSGWSVPVPLCNVHGACFFKPDLNSSEMWGTSDGLKSRRPKLLCAEI